MKQDFQRPDADGPSAPAPTKVFARRGGLQANAAGIRRRLGGICAALLLLSLGACKSKPPAPEPVEESVQPGDHLSFQLSADSDPLFRCTVDPDGYIIVPDIGRMHVADLSLREIAAAVKERYLPRITPEIEIKKYSP